MKTAVLIPCYNEEKTIKDVVADFKSKAGVDVLQAFNADGQDVARNASLFAAGAVVVRNHLGFQRKPGYVVLAP